MTGIDNGYNPPSLEETLTYDALGRLTTANSPSENESYTYDVDGNRTYQVVNGQPTTFAYASGSNRLASSVGPGAAPTDYGYDADGNTITVIGLEAHTYGPFGRLINAGGMAGGVNTYAYVGGNPITNVDPLSLCPKCALSQEIAAKLGTHFGAESNVTGAFATTTGALTRAAAGAELPSGGTDTPITAGLAVATSRAATASVITGLASAGFTLMRVGTYLPSGGFLAGEITSGAVGILASHFSGVSTAATDYLKNAAGLVAGNAANPSPPCQQ